VAATPDDIDRALTDALERLRTAVGVDRAVLLEYAEDWSSVLITHAVYGEGVPPIPERVNIREMFPWADRRLQSGETLFIGDVSALPPEAATDRAHFERLSTAALLIVPIFQTGGGFRHALVVDTARERRTGRRARAPPAPPRPDHGARPAAQPPRGRPGAALGEVSALKDRLESENVYLRGTVEGASPLEGVVAASPAMAEVVALVRRVAPTDSAVLLLGETGTGNEMLARAIHRLSARRERLLVTVNCAALPAALVESELFGREKGAYTGAVSRQAGRFELADQSTLFLDEVGELPLELQAKLLRVLETGEFREARQRQDDAGERPHRRRHQPGPRGGGGRGELPEGPLLPPQRLPAPHPPASRTARRRAGPAVGDRERARREDGGAVSRRSPAPSSRGCSATAGRETCVSSGTSWKRALILGSGPVLDIRLPPDPGTEGYADETTLEGMERRHIRRTLEATRGRIRGPGGAAERLGLHEATLRSADEEAGDRAAHGVSPTPRDVPG